jgi:hypothetical protein
MTTATTARICAQCGDSIDHLRSGARFCGSTCRGRKLRAKGPRCGWCSRRIGPGRRYGSAYCSAACERADEALEIAEERGRKTLMRASDPPAKGMTPDTAPDACGRCGGATHTDEFGDARCVMCGRAAA